MRRSWLLVANCCALLTLAACASSTSGTTPDPTPTPIPDCVQTAPCALQPDVAMTGAITKKGQANYYTIEVSASAGPRTIVRLKLDRTAPVSAVRPVFTLTNSDGTVAIGTRGPQDRSGAVHLSANFLMPGPGTYRIVVRDVDNAAMDTRNPYLLTASIFSDPDQGEPDDAPASARALVASTASTGFIASTGDRDLLALNMPAEGLMRFVLNQEVVSSVLRLRMRVLKRSTQSPNDLALASVVSEFLAARAGTALRVDAVRLLGEGAYFIELTDENGLNADATPLAQWALTTTATTEPDPQDQGSTRNDSPETATAIAADGSTSLQGVIGSQGDRDWFKVSLPNSTDARIVEVQIDPQQANSEVNLLWAVGEQLATPAGTCDLSCGPSLFCAGSKCGYKVRAMRNYDRNDFSPQVVRIRHQGAARDIFVLVSDQGDDERSLKTYSLRLSVFSDPDANEPQAANDQLSAATPLSFIDAGDGALSVQGAGTIGWWDFVDGRGTFQQAEDTDWFELALPPRDPLPCDPSTTDGGCPTAPDGGPLYEPRPDYGLVMHWKGPTDKTYELGLQGTASVDGQKTACLFSFDQRIAHSDGNGGFTLGNGATDPCFCLPAAQAEFDRLWVRIDAPHRPDPPQKNRYSDQNYVFELELRPNSLLPACAGKCSAITRTSSCP